MDVDSSVLAILLPFVILCLSSLPPPSSRLFGGVISFLISLDCTFAGGHQYCFKEDNLFQQEGMKIPT